MLMEKSLPHAYAVHRGHHEYANVMQAEVEKEMEAWKSTEK